jgi:hypothetical protein
LLERGCGRFDLAIGTTDFTLSATVLTCIWASTFGTSDVSCAVVLGAALTTSVVPSNTATVHRLTHSVADAAATRNGSRPQPLRSYSPSWRINDRPFSDTTLSRPIVFMNVWIVINAGASFWWQRRSLRQDLLPRKLRLEALLKDLDTP